MSSLQPQTNEALPFDILGIIFSYYASEETIHHPVETLLQVCRFWADAALGHQTLWSHLKIYIGHSLTIKAWGVRLPLRLARAGPTTPLYIDLRNYLDMPYCTQAQRDVKNGDLFSSLPCYRDGDAYDDELCACYKTARAYAHEALQQLTGKSGEICARWRSLELDLGHSEDGIKGTEPAAIALSYPMPQLTTLVLKNVQFDDEISLSLFPSVPLLNNITIVDCNLPSLPPFDNVRQAVIGWKENTDDFQDFSAFREATRVESLHLHIPFTAGMCLPDRFSGLQELHLSGNNFPHDLYHCQMPILSSLTLEYQYENLLAHILNCKGFVPQKLRRITLLWDLPAHPTSGHILKTFSSLMQLLTRARNLECITADKEMLNILLKVIWRFAKAGPPQEYNIKGPLVDGIWIINLSMEDSVHLRGDETPERLEEIADDWDLMPLHGSKAKFISLLQVQAAFHGIFDIESQSELE